MPRHRDRPARSAPRGGLGPIVALALALGLAAPSLARAQALSDQLKDANSAFQFGDYGRVIQILGNSAIDSLPEEKDRIEAYRLLGLSFYYLKQPTAAQALDHAKAEFYNLLTQDPDYELDSYFVPLEAIKFFDSVRREYEPKLAPIRKFKREREAAEKREAEARRNAMSQGPGSAKVVNLSLSSPVVAVLPFGLGQFQNGEPGLGIGMAVGQGIGALSSVLSFLMVEVLRDPGSGDFKGGDYQVAQTLNVVKWVGAGIFYGLWVAGATEALVRYVPSRVVSEGPPAAAPAGPLRAPPPAKAAPPLVIPAAPAPGGVNMGAGPPGVSPAPSDPPPRY